MNMDELNKKQKERVGIITVPSGTLVIADPEFIGTKNSQLVLEGFAKNTVIEVFGEVNEFSPWLEKITLIADNHNHGGKNKTRIELGASLLFADSKVIKHYGKPLDDSDDLEFWGGDEDNVARSVHAVRLDDGKWGFPNLTSDTMEEKIQMLEDYQTSGKMVVWGARKHTNADQLLKAMNSSPTSSGSAEIEGVHVFSCLVPTQAIGMQAEIIVQYTVDGAISRIDLSF